MPKKTFKSIAEATLYVFDQWKPGRKFHTTELMGKVSPLLEPKVVKDKNGITKIVQREPFPDSYLKVLRKYRRELFVCINRSESYYEKVEAQGVSC